MVEFGLALPVLLLVMYGLIESGRLLFLYASVVSAARQAVRYGSATGLNTSGTPYYNDCAGIRSTAKGFGFIQPFSDSNIQIGYDNGPGASTPWSQTTCPIASSQHPANGDRINVRVSTQYAPIVPLVPFRPFTITSSGWRTLLISIPIAVDVPGVVLPPGTGGALSISKDAWCSACTPPGSYYERVGQSITYTFLIHNSGTDPVAIINTTDTKLGTICAGVTNMPASTTTTCTETYVVTQADIDAGHITNVVTIQGVSNSVPLAAQATKTINFVPRPALLIAKTGDVATTVARGNPVDYTYTLTNTGNVPLTSFAIFDSNLNSWTCSGATSPLGLNASTTCTGTHLLTSNDINNKFVDNTAYATALYNGFTVTSNTVTLRVLVPGLLLQVASCNSNPPCAVGSIATITGLNQTFYFTYWLTNRQSSLNGLGKVSDNRGASNFTCSAWTFLPTGVAQPCTRSSTGTPAITYSQTDLDNPLGQFLTTVNGSASFGKPSNTATVAVTVTQNAAFTLSKTANLSQATTVGTTITYTYKFTNTGNVTLGPPYAVNDDKIPPQGNCSSMSGSLPPGGTPLTCTRTYQVTQADLDAGSVINHATATATFNASGGPQTVNSTAPPASATVWTFIGARLGLIKSASPNVYNAENQTITYTYTLKNTGSITLGPPYTVSDPKITSGVNCSGVTGPLPQGGTVACTATYPISSTDMTNPSVTNTASATAMNGATSIPSTNTDGKNTVVINRFICTTTTLTHLAPTPIPSSGDAIWTLVNNTGMALHMTSITISWSSGPPYLQNVLLNGVSIWSGLSPSSGGFVLPTPVSGWWLLPTGNSPLELRYSGTAAGIRVFATFQESGCPSVDSNVP